MATKKRPLAITSWILHFRDAGSNSNKFYEVYVGENGLCVLRWGRIGSTGQSSVTRYSSYDEARDHGLKQVFAKKAKGYVTQYSDMKFMVDADIVDHTQMASDPAGLVNAFRDSLSKGQFDGAKEAVLKHYADFADQAQRLMDRAGRQSLDEVIGEYEQLESVWDEINDKHSEIEAVMSIAKQTMAQKLMGV